MAELFRVRVKQPHLEVEVESTDRAYVDAKMEQYLKDQSWSTPTDSRDNGHPEPRQDGSRRRPLSIGEFVKQINPDKKNEAAATIAYFLEYHADPIIEEWKPDQVADKFADVRKAKPANITDLLQKSNFFMSGREKGSYRLSETGVAWVEDQVSDRES